MPTAFKNVHIHVHYLASHYNKIDNTQPTSKTAAAIEEVSEMPKKRGRGRLRKTNSPVSDSSQPIRRSARVQAEADIGSTEQRPPPKPPDPSPEVSKLASTGANKIESAIHRHVIAKESCRLLNRDSNFSVLCRLDLVGIWKY